MKKIYFAAPLFNDAEKEFNINLTTKLEGLGFEVFLPQRDGVESNKEPYSFMGKEERRKAMFELDRNMVEQCDIFLFTLDGRVPDEGACVELGIAYTHKRLVDESKTLIGLQTDSRAAFIGAKLNPMIRVPLDFICDSTEELIERLRNQLTVRL